MFLSNAALKKIHQLIRNSHNSVVYNLITRNGVLTDKEISDLKKAGLIDDTLRQPLQDSYIFGRLQHLLGRQQTRDMGLADFLRYAAENFPPLTILEKEAISYASQSAGKYIQNLGSRLSNKVNNLVDDLSAPYMQKVLQKIVPKNIAARETAGRLKSQLHTEIGASVRDFEKIAFTELQNAMQMGIANTITRIDSEAKVVKLPRPDACKWCVKVFKKPNGDLRVFKLSSLMGKSNVGKKKKDWTAVADSVHPFCSCQMIHIPKGWVWNNKTMSLMPGSNMKARLKKGVWEYQQKDLPWESGDTDDEKRVNILGTMLRHISSVDKKPNKQEQFLKIKQIEMTDRARFAVKKSKKAVPRKPKNLKGV